MDESQLTSDYRSDSLSEIDHFPWTYTHVCRHMRNAIISAPEMWTTLPTLSDGRLVDDQRAAPTSSTTQEAALELAKVHLARSGDLPLTVNLRFHYQLRIGIPKSFAAVALQSHRWRKLTLNADLMVYRGMARESSRWNFPRLETLHVEISEFYPEDEDPSSVFSMFADCPKLTEFVATTSDRTFRNLRLPLSQLRKLHFNAEIREAHLLWWPQAFVQCTNLTDLRVMVSGVPFQIDTPILLPRVQFFAFEATEEDTKSLFTIFDLPSVLHISIAILTLGRMGTVLVGWLSTQGSNLISLDLQGLQYSAQRVGDAARFADILLCVPNISSLSISPVFRSLARDDYFFQQDNNSFTISTIIAQLDCSTARKDQSNSGRLPEGSGVLCPHLTELKLEHVVISESKPLMKMIESRIVSQKGSATHSTNPEFAPKAHLRLVHISLHRNAPYRPGKLFNQKQATRLKRITIGMDFVLKKAN
jgi:hypothetical protein